MSENLPKLSRPNKLPAKIVGGQTVSLTTGYSKVLELETYRAEIEKHATYDPLTGLYNRRALQEEFQRVISRMQRTGSKASIILLDIDHFKKVNDTFGHDAGDEVLKTVSKIISDDTRPTDITTRMSQEKPGYSVGRWGGEEMAILLEDTDLEGAMVAAEHLRESILLGTHETGIPVTASFGVLDIKPELSLASNVAKVDMALYAAKHGGRNQVVAYSDSLPDKPGQA